MSESARGREGGREGEVRIPPSLSLTHKKEKLFSFRSARARRKMEKVARAHSSVFLNGEQKKKTFYLKTRRLFSYKGMFTSVR